MIKCGGISESQIEQLDEPNDTFLVNSQSERGVKYLVDRVCSCNAGKDGSLCSHQAAIVKHFHIPCVNCIPTLSPETRQHLAMIAIGPQAVQDPNFYSSLHQKKHEESLCHTDSTQYGDPSMPDVTGTTKGSHAIFCNGYPN